MKKIITFACAALIAVAGLSAQGMMGGGRGQDQQPLPAQTTTLTGTVTMESGQPEIKANGKTWTLVAPLRSIVFLPWKEGAAVTVTGYALEAQKLAGGVSVSDRIVAVSITLGGKTYDIPLAGRGNGGMGHGDMDGQDNQSNGRGRGRGN